MQYGLLPSHRASEKIWHIAYLDEWLLSTAADFLSVHSGHLRWQTTDYSDARLLQTQFSTKMCRPDVATQVLCSYRIYNSIKGADKSAGIVKTITHIAT